MALNINQRLNGLNPLAYQGDNAVQPPDFVTKNRPPTINDLSNFALGDIWLDTTGYPAVLPTAANIYMLVALVGNQATWVHFIGGVISITAGENLNNSGTSVNPVINLDRIIRWPDTTSDGLNGAIYLGATCSGNECTGGTLFMHNFGALNTFLGSGAGNLFTSGTGGNVGIGTSVLSNISTGYQNVAIGAAGTSGSAGSSISSGNRNVMIGAGAGGSATAALTNVFIGTDAGSSVVGSSGCVAIGNDSMSSSVSGNNNTCLGVNTALNLVSGGGNLILGASSGAALTGGESNNMLINSSGVTGYTGLNNIGNVYDDYGVANTFVGRNAGNHAIDLANCINNTSTGFSSLTSLTTGFQNSCFGGNSGNSIEDGFQNCLIGFNSGTSITSGNRNICIGVLSGSNLTTSQFNVLIGTSVGNQLTTAGTNTVIGFNALSAATGSASNCILGSEGGRLLTTGSANCLFGNTSGLNYTSTESANILIGTNCRGVIGDQRTLRIGFDSTGGSLGVLTSFIAGIAGVNVVGSAVLVGANGQLGVTVSSARFKENIEPMGNDSSFIYKLRPVTFNYKKDASKSKQWGLIAEEVAVVEPRLAAYDNEGVPESVKYHELPAILLNEIQKLRAELRNFNQLIDELTFRVELLESRMQK